MVSKFFYFKMFLYLLPNTSINVIYMDVVEFYSLLILKLVFFFPSVPPFFGFLAAKPKPYIFFFFFLPDNSHDQTQPKPTIGFLGSSKNCWLSEFENRTTYIFLVWYDVTFTR